MRSIFTFKDWNSFYSMDLISFKRKHVFRNISIIFMDVSINQMSMYFRHCGYNYVENHLKEMGGLGVKCRKIANEQSIFSLTFQ